MAVQITIEGVPEAVRDALAAHAALRGQSYSNGAAYDAADARGVPIWNCGVCKPLPLSQ